APATVLRVRDGHSIALRDRPRGRALATLGDHTEFGSPTALSVAARRGHWVGVPSPQLGNGRLGWVDARSDSLVRRTTDVRLTVDLSHRRLELRVRGRVRRRVTVAIGRPGSETPRGRFSITDKLTGSRYGRYYGCCILALSGTQPNPPPGWTGGNRLAIHGTNAPSTIGTPASAGCLRAADGDLQVLMRRVPLGTPVRIRG
ncbi:MAG TPA: L,D-transpeptidase, partial [Thermoleophilaceae bacterium]|nr:L,D-transpeptidase [Thermoleophilaceae bacterium]